MRSVPFNGSLSQRRERGFFGPVGSLRPGHSLVSAPAPASSVSVRPGGSGCVVYIIRRDVAKGFVAPLGVVPRDEPGDRGRAFSLTTAVRVHSVSRHSDLHRRPAALVERHFYAHLPPGRGTKAALRLPAHQDLDRLARLPQQAAQVADGFRRQLLFSARLLLVPKFHLGPRLRQPESWAGIRLRAPHQLARRHTGPLANAERKGAISASWLTLARLRSYSLI